MDPTVLIAAVARIVLYVAVLIAGARVKRRHWQIGAACVFAIASNAALIDGDLFWAGVCAMPFAGLNVLIYLDRMRNDPRTLRALLGSKESAWSKERHEIVNELAAERARVDMLERRLKS